MRIAKVGWFIIARGVIGAAAGFLLSRFPGFYLGGYVLMVLGVAFALFAAYFFRDPERPLPQDPGKIYSPGDGRVLSVEQEGHGGAVTIRIFLSIFNVHIQRAPCTGTVKDAQYFHGGFRAAMAKEARQNERCVIHLAPEGRDCVLVVEQIAGLIARRIECWVGAGDSLVAGERYGLIRFGSQAALTVPAGTFIRVVPGDRVQAGITPIAEWTN